MKNIRNFVIISHIDHGKSTLADRLLEATGTIEQRKMREQFLDMMDLEREKGITIKLQPVRMEYDGYILNLIDTPGHIDFSYEVSRSLAAVEGALLLVDASQGIQAQTLTNLHLAQEQNLIIIPVINKIDLSRALIEETAQEINQLLGIDKKEIVKISAKDGTNVDRLLKAIVKRVPSPKRDLKNPLRALIFDSHYDTYKGAIAYVRIVDGQVKKGDRIIMSASKAAAEVVEVGIFRPQLTQADSLKAGEIGYLATGLKDVGQSRVGDTIGLLESKIKPLIGYQEPKPMVFASFYPVQAPHQSKLDAGQADDYNLLKDGLAKLKLNDASLQYQPESSKGLGRGFRCGFLGMLHLEVISERLKREYGTSLIVTSPSVSYQVGRNQIKEPWVNLKIISPSQYLGQVMKLLSKTRGKYQDTQYLSPERVLIKYQAPLNEIIVDFYDQLKNITAGYASMSYQMAGYQPADLVRLDILAAGEKIEALSRIVHRKRAEKEARFLVNKLKKLIPRHQFVIPLQAVVDGRIIARETISALKKNVIAGLYGGDYTRKRKLLEKQKKGKKKMKKFGRVNIPQEVFLKVLKR